METTRLMALYQDLVPVAANWSAFCTRLDAQIEALRATRHDYEEKGPPRPLRPAQAPYSAESRRAALEEARRLAATGDGSAALDLLVDVLGQAIHRFCRSMVRNDALADDACQLAFIQAYSRLDSLSQASSIEKWLFALARNRCIDELRRKHADPLDDPDAEASAESSVPTDELLSLREDRARLARAIEALDCKRREAVLLHLQGFSYVEMAEMCSAEPATLQARVSSSVPLLQRALTR
jgi:RNA polymerase sigma factor (sigma-70 family)